MFRVCTTVRGMHTYIHTYINTPQVPKGWVRISVCMVDDAGGESKEIGQTESIMLHKLVGNNTASWHNIVCRPGQLRAQEAQGMRLWLELELRGASHVLGDSGVTPSASLDISALNHSNGSFLSASTTTGANKLETQTQTQTQTRTNGVFEQSTGVSIHDSANATEGKTPAVGNGKGSQGSVLMDVTLTVVYDDLAAKSDVERYAV
jgi:hypothetical protein